MNIIAIDLGKFNSMVCFYDSNTQKHRFMNAKTEQGYFRNLLTNHRTQSENTSNSRLIPIVDLYHRNSLTSTRIKLRADINKEPKQKTKNQKTPAKKPLDKPGTS